MKIRKLIDLDPDVKMVLEHIALEQGTDLKNLIEGILGGVAKQYKTEAL